MFFGTLGGILLLGIDAHPGDSDVEAMKSWISSLRVCDRGDKREQTKPNSNNK